MAATGQSQIVETLVDLSNRAAENTGIEIAEVQLRGSGKARLLRIYIDKAGGVSHSDCELISQRVSQALDDSSLLPEESYTLEVSSLGPDRRLVTARDFERVIGQNLAIMLRAPDGGAGKDRVEGTLLRVSADQLELETPGNTPSNKLLTIPLSQVGKAKLKYRF